MSEDHDRLLQLGKAALDAANNAKAWRGNPEAAADAHGHWCDQLWAELERQVSARDGLEVLEHPHITARKAARRMRKTIVTVAANAVAEALDELDLTELE